MKRIDEYPFADSKLARFLKRYIVALEGITPEHQIAQLAGFRTVEYLRMVADGKSKLPLDKVENLAFALHCDTGFLLRLALEQTGLQFVGELLSTHYGFPMSENEEKWIEELRNVSDETDPPVLPEGVEALEKVVRQWRKLRFGD